MWAWRAALAVFVLAGSTGALFRLALMLKDLRLAMAAGDTFGLDPVNVRHAHSHLMYFGWATPALFALIARRLPALGGREVPHVRRVIGATFALALLSFPSFLLFGYGPAEVGGARLPLSVIASALNVLAWYAFAAVYLRARRDAPPSPALRVLDLAVLFLVLSTMGAWGLPVVVATDGSDALKAALTHLFLDAFSEGWFVLGVLGLAAVQARVTDARGRVLRIASWAVAAGVPFVFALGMAPALVPPTFAALARLGGVLVGGGLLVAVAVLAPRVGGLWRVALGLLALKASGEVAVAAWPDGGWAALPAYRILYLHLMLLGFVTLGLVAAARDTWGARATRGAGGMAVAVGLLLVSLVPLTPLWPSVWGGAWVPWAVAACALGPVLVAAWMVLRGRPRPPP